MRNTTAMLVLKHAAVVFALTLVAGFFVGFFAALAHIEPAAQRSWFIGGEWIISIAGFCWVAVSHPTRRGMHICLVAAAYWLLCAVGIALETDSALGWLLSSIKIAVQALLGFLLSFLFLRSRSAKHEAAA
jgi:hypothetical protein